jgi:aryl-alcohol dehydrogenase-like predicted oxidoreductase
MNRSLEKHWRPIPEELSSRRRGGLVRIGPDQWHPLGRPEYLTQQVELSLRFLRVERIDLWQLHRIDPKVPAEESLGAIKRLQEAGKIRHVGLSEVSVPQIESARKVVEIVSVQNEYNIITRKSEHVLRYCEANGLAFIPWFPVAAGRLAGPNAKLDPIAKQHNATVCSDLVGMASATFTRDASDSGNLVIGASARESPVPGSGSVTRRTLGSRRDCLSCFDIGTQDK